MTDIVTRTQNWLAPRDTGVRLSTSEDLVRDLLAALKNAQFAIREMDDFIHPDDRPSMSKRTEAVIEELSRD